MSSSTVSFRDAEFVANDLPIEVWLIEVVGQIDKQERPEAWLRELRDEWYLQATAGFGFGVCAQLDKFVTTDNRKERLLGIFASAMDALTSRGPVVPVDELYSSGVGGPSVTYLRPLPTETVFDVARQFVSLLTAGQVSKPTRRAQ
jgi:hypothetical protein